MKSGTLCTSALAVVCAGCVFQQTSATDVRVRDARLVAVRDALGRVTLQGDGEPREIRAFIEPSKAHAGRNLPPAQAPPRVRRDATGEIALIWSDGPDTLVSGSGVVHAGNARALEARGLGDSELSVPFRSEHVDGPCVRHRGYWTCKGADVIGALTTPWSNVSRVHRHVEPIAHEWGTFDVVVGVLLTSIGTTFLVPPYTRRAARDDVELGIAFAAPGLLALVNGVAIFFRAPYDENWPARY